MKKYILTLLVLSPFSLLFAQEDQPNKSDKIESYRIAFITQKLNLTPKEATVFWPVYNEYYEQVKTLRAKDKERNAVFKAKENPTEQEADKFMNENLAFRQQEVDLIKKYVGEFRKVLTASKVARLLTLEQEFKMQLLQKIKERSHYEKP